MARQIAYDPVNLRQNLLAVFWSNGYRHTSLFDLEQATGLNRRQLYNGLGDKKAMFVTALQDFDDVAGRQFLAALERPKAGIKDIQLLLRGFVELARSDEGPGGCMVCSASQEEIASDPEVRPLIDAYFNRIRAAYANALTCARDRGEIALNDEQIAAKSAMLLGVHVGLCILGRAGADNRVLSLMAEEACATL